jgi:hypothetical protein
MYNLDQFTHKQIKSPKDFYVSLWVTWRTALLGIPKGKFSKQMKKKKLSYRIIRIKRIFSGVYWCITWTKFLFCYIYILYVNFFDNSAITPSTKGSMFIITMFYHVIMTFYYLIMKFYKIRLHYHIIKLYYHMIKLSYHMIKLRNVSIVFQLPYFQTLCFPL